MHPAFDDQPIQLHIILKSFKFKGFDVFLQLGVGVKTRIGKSVNEFFSEDLGLTPQYVETRIQTVFLDGKAVDDLDSAVLEDGSTLALSAAMPGLLGATLRRGSYYAPMRGEISYRPAQKQAAQAEPGTVLVKLFNQLLGELGPVFLRRGVLIRNEDFRIFLQRQGNAFSAACLKAVLNGRQIEPKDLRTIEWEGKDVLLRVLPDDESEPES